MSSKFTDTDIQWPHNALYSLDYSSFHFPLDKYCCLCADVASKEQEKPIMPPEENEEGDCEDAAMETEMQDEDLRAVDTEELKPEKNKSSATKPPGTLTCKAF